MFPLFAISVVDIGGKFAAGIVYGGKFALVSTTPAVPGAKLTAVVVVDT